MFLAKHNRSVSKAYSNIAKRQLTELHKLLNKTANNGDLVQSANANFPELATVIRIFLMAGVAKDAIVKVLDERDWQGYTAKGVEPEHQDSRHSMLCRYAERLAARAESVDTSI